VIVSVNVFAVVRVRIPRAHGRPAGIPLVVKVAFELLVRLCGSGARGAYALGEAKHERH